MNKVEHCELKELAERLGGRIDHLVMSVSYEDRALGVWEAIQKNVRRGSLVFFNENHSDYLSANVEKVRKSEAGASFFALDSDRPLVTFDGLRGAVKILEEVGPSVVVIDITGFTREALCILVYLIEQQLTGTTRVVCVYHKAQAYGAFKGGGWLSQGVREVRNILGFSGQARLTGNTHLILLPGFEVDRALEIIESVQPLRLSLGFVTATNSVSAAHHEALENFVTRLEAYYTGREIQRFYFSSVDPFVTRDSILAIRLKGIADENVVVSCLHTKPAAVGAALACIQDASLQLIYAQPVCYNIMSYSKPSGEVLFFDLPLRTR